MYYCLESLDLSILNRKSITRCSGIKASFAVLVAVLNSMTAVTDLLTVAIPTILGVIFAVDVLVAIFIGDVPVNVVVATFADDIPIDLGYNCFDPWVSPCRLW